MAESFRVAIPVRWSDQDANGHVNNARVATFLEETRVLWRAANTALDSTFRKNTIVASLTIDYRRPTVYGVTVDISLAVSRIGTKSYTLRYKATQEDATTFEATSVMVLLGVEGKARVITDHERAALGRWLDATEAKNSPTKQQEKP